VAANQSIAVNILPLGTSNLYQDQFHFPVILRPKKSKAAIWVESPINWIRKRHGISNCANSLSNFSEQFA
jgi:hypothetical protein